LRGADIFDYSSHSRGEHRAEGISFSGNAEAFHLAHDFGLVLRGLDLLARCGNLTIGRCICRFDLTVCCGASDPDSSRPGQ
jgi:hypothetical protein